MSATWACVLIIVVLNVIAVAALIAHYTSEERFRRHANQAIDLTGGSR